MRKVALVGVLLAVMAAMNVGCVSTDYETRFKETAKWAEEQVQAEEKASTTKPYSEMTEDELATDNWDEAMEVYRQVIPTRRRLQEVRRQLKESPDKQTAAKEALDFAVDARNVRLAYGNMRLGQAISAAEYAITDAAEPKATATSKRAAIEAIKVVRRAEAGVAELEKIAAEADELAKEASSVDSGAKKPESNPSAQPASIVEFKGHRYQVVSQARTWNEAKKACEEAGGHLVTIGDAEENEFVTKLCGGKNMWIGLTDEKTPGKWQWVDGKELEVQGWAEGEPSGTGGIEHYGHYCFASDSFIFDGWNDIPDDGGGLVGGYVCEWDK